MASSPPPPFTPSAHTSVMINEYSVCASAPGKVILFGEHAVVYGVPAIAAALSDLRIYVIITPHFKDNNDNKDSNDIEETQVCISMPDLPTPIINYRMKSLAVFGMKDLQTPPTPNCASKCAEVIREQQQQQNQVSNVNTETFDFVVTALLPVVYLLNQLIPSTSNLTKTNLDVLVRSASLPVGAGLGSSAAFGVAMTAAIVQLRNKYASADDNNSNNKNQQQQNEQYLQLGISNKDRQIIDTYSYYSEVLLHGTPSGLDNAVSAHGGAILFTKSLSESSNNSNNTRQQLSNFTPLEILLVHTHVPRSTKELVANVRKLYDRHNSVVKSILQAIRAIVEEFQSLMMTWNDSNDSSSKQSLTNTAAMIKAELTTTRTTINTGEENIAMLDLLTLVRMNQSLLSALQVSHECLDLICQIVSRVAPNQAAAKLTGAGGGGCALVLLKPGMSETESTNVKQNIIRALHEHQGEYNFQVFSSSLGGPGVQYINPANDDILKQIIQQQKTTNM